MGLKVTGVLCLTLLVLGLAKTTLGNPIPEDEKNTDSELELKDEKIHELEHKIEEAKEKDLTEKIKEQKNIFKIISKLVQNEYEVIKLLKKDDIKKEIKIDQNAFENEVEKTSVKEKAVETPVTEIPSEVDESLTEEENKTSNEEVSGSGDEGSGEENSGVDGSGSDGIETELVVDEIIGSVSQEPITADVVNDKDNADVKSHNVPKDEGFMDYQEKGKVDRPTQTDDNVRTNSESDEHKNLYSANDAEHVEALAMTVHSATYETVTMVDKDYSELNNDTQKNEPQSEKPKSEEGPKSEQEPESKEKPQSEQEPPSEYEPQSEKSQSEEEPQSEQEPQSEKPQSEEEPQREQEPLSKYEPQSEKPQSEEEPQSEQEPESKEQQTEAEHRNDEGHVSIVAVSIKENQQNKKAGWLNNLLNYLLPV